MSPFGVNETVISLLPAAVEASDGGAGTVAGIAASETGDGALVPIAFVAVTAHEYVSPLKRLVTVIGDAEPDAECVSPLPDDVQVAVKLVIAPPLSAGALNATTIRSLPAVVTGTAGVAGAPAGMTDTVAGDGAPLPAPFVAATVHVYVLPLVRPTTVRVRADAGPVVVPRMPPSLDVQVAVYPVIATPWSAGAT